MRRAYVDTFQQQARIAQCLFGRCKPQSSAHDSAICVVVSHGSEWDMLETHVRACLEQHAMMRVKNLIAMHIPLDALHQICRI